MIIVLSPAKSLDYESELSTRKHSEPRLLEEAMRLVDVLRGMSVSELAGMMGISGELAALNAQRFADFSVPFTPENSRQALLTFHGDVYLGMDAPGSFCDHDYVAAQQSLRILSGLYGVLRPLDLMQPYRLEMGTKLDTGTGASLYDFWGDTITDTLGADLLAAPGPDVLVNLASKEYFKSVRTHKLGTRIVAPRFEDTSARGKRSIVSFYAKRARGAMAGWIVRNGIDSVSALNSFEALGYRYDAVASTVDEPVFVRSFEARTTS